MFELIYGKKIGFRAPCARVLKIFKDHRVVAYIDDLCPEDKVDLSLMDEENNERNVRLSIIRAGHNEPNIDGEERGQVFYLSQDRIDFQIFPYELYDSTFDKWNSDVCVKQTYVCEDGEWVRGKTTSNC